jgi:hypothetical protein
MKITGKDSSNSKNANSGQVQAVVSRARWVMLGARLLMGLLIWLALCLGMWLALFLLDNLLHLPAGIRLPATLAGFGVMLYTLWHRLLSPLFHRHSLESTALHLEQHYGVSENMLINAMQFESRQLQAHETPFAKRTINTGSTSLSPDCLKDLWQWKVVGKWLCAAGVIVLIWGVYGIGRDRYAVNALARFALPLADVPPAGAVAFELTPSGATTVREGDNLQVLVKVSADDGNSDLAVYPRIVWVQGGDFVNPEKNEGASAPMHTTQSERGLYKYTFSRVNRPFAFRVYAANTYSRNVKVAVITLPSLKDSTFHITPPLYTAGAYKSAAGPPEPLHGLAGSRVVVDVRLDKSCERVVWKSPAGEAAFIPADEIWKVETDIKESGVYRIEVEKREFVGTIVVATGSISLQPDPPPQVEFMTGERNLDVYPGERLRLAVEASDDYGVARTWVSMRAARGGSATETVREWKYKGPPGKKRTVEEMLFLSIDASKYTPGSQYILEVFCGDFCPAGNVGRSQPLLLSIKRLEELSLDAGDPDNAAFAALAAAIEAQQVALGVSRNLISNIDDVLVQKRDDKANIKALRQQCKAMETRQITVGQHLGRAWDASVEPRPDFVHRMIELRDREHTRALVKMAAAAKGRLPKKQDCLRSLRSVEKMQVYLLDQLIALRGAVARQKQAEAEKAAASMLGQQEETLDSGPDESLREMKRELKEFVLDQKDIMNRRGMLMDRPPEDFSDEDAEELEELALDQSKLAEILAHAVNDFTNMDLQDFGDNAMVDSMKSVFQETDELAAKAREAAEMRQVRVDAYRLETEAVEMAEEILINCEAVLGFYDSIQFIAEIAEDEQLVAPLAELPFELEDIVADLITSEEEMLPEVEDIGSYLNSLDHTAGPLGDGTISSLSAKGITGDQKPEDNIIQGRSGAGRSGMSDGQLVESVAKALPQNEYGLRERTSNTPLESGLVKDEDLRAQTGGTGLGKSTDGASPFGAGGNLPPKVLDMMRSTMGKQRQIIQFTKDLAPRLKQHNLPSQQLEDSVKSMQGLVDALQKRDGVGIRRSYSAAVNGLKKSHHALGEQIRVQYTSSSAMKRKLDGVLSRERDQRFKDYEHIISAYFEALAKQESSDE